MFEREDGIEIVKNTKVTIVAPNNQPIDVAFIYTGVIYPNAKEDT